MKNVDRWAADLSEPPDGQDLQESMDEYDETDIDDADPEFIRAERSALRLQIDRYSNSLRKLTMAWAKEQTRLERLLIDSRGYR